MRADISGILTITVNQQIQKLIEILNVTGYSVNPHPANPEWINVYCPIKRRNVIKEISTQSKKGSFQLRNPKGTRWLSFRTLGIKIENNDFVNKVLEHIKKS
ncbi:hypothetical protein QNH39_10365 [Neobacillus novalis]|uniref:Uncharacterized protein n=1 Tax=Neobacillus novalis TaxID=220687 RepID=A0AA95MUE9_9BACI|nr:hypothetical protein [Neobacillus novalis]WHY88210.1 hypothetical protein QNH39_10365 [Neobacillus novalis]